MPKVKNVPGVGAKRLQQKATYEDYRAMGLSEATARAMAGKGTVIVTAGNGALDAPLTAAERAAHQAQLADERNLVLNPKTGRWIKRNGPTHKALMAENKPK